MRPNRQHRDAPAWLSDARIRRQITEQIKQRRAKRIRALEAFELTLRDADLRPAQKYE